MIEPTLTRWGGAPAGAPLARGAASTPGTATVIRGSSTPKCATSRRAVAGLVTTIAATWRSIAVSPAISARARSSHQYW